MTYLIRRAGGAWVLRRPPRPPLPPSAHDVLREARLLSAVQDAAVRTPRVLATCDDESVIGAPFYVMEQVDGDVLTSDVPAGARRRGRSRARIGEELVDALVEIHAVDWRACGLEGYGKPTGYLDRQLRRFGGLWEHNRTRELPVLDRVTAWLAEHKPESGEATIVHGDYRLGNTMFAPGAPAAAGRDLRLGAGDDRRPAGGRRLPRRDLGAAGRRRGRRCSASAPSRGGRASRRASS